MSERVLYESSNGDSWSLARDPASNLPAVKHQPNPGGQTSYMPIGSFLVSGASSSEKHGLLKLIGTTLGDG
ncbi:hypothetical protein V1290_000233 [Bradyrhizobium sp. AZCC 1578]|uniref:hypothetical protein n=1 Tax=Bradyrhizobium sp. AZCC 1578 TaxID=3117027 RepID=UPI002FF0CE35